MKFEKINSSYNDHEIILLRPENAGKKWVWRAEFPGAFDYADKALMEEGWNVLYYRVSDLFGSPESVELMKNFHDFAVKEFDIPLSAKSPATAESSSDIFWLSFCHYPSMAYLLVLLNKIPA